MKTRFERCQLRFSCQFTSALAFKFLLVQLRFRIFELPLQAVERCYSHANHQREYRADLEAPDDQRGQRLSHFPSEQADYQATRQTANPAHSNHDEHKNSPLDCAVLILSLIHISEPTRLLSISYAVFCLKKKKTT